MVNIIDAEPAHVPAIVAHAIGVAQESEGLRPDSDTVLAAVTAAIADPRKARYFVAEAEGQVVGSLYVTFEWSDWNNGWYWWIQGVFVEPDWRRRGVMGRLVAAVKEAARSAGDVERIRLYVERNNTGARAGYESLGMQETAYRIYETAP